jgi:hypothetical protein
MAEGTRIRYKQATDGNFLTEDLLGGVDLYRGVLVPYERKARVERLVNGVYSLYKETTYTNSIVAKRFVKETLKEAGVRFYDEVRKKRKTVVVSEELS